MKADCSEGRQLDDTINLNYLAMGRSKENKTKLVIRVNSRFLVFVILLLTTATTFVLLRQGKPEPIDKEDVNTNEKITFNDLTISDWPSFPATTEKWDTYVHREMGFKVKYPSDRVVVHTDTEKHLIFTKKELNDLGSGEVPGIRFSWMGERGTDALNLIAGYRENLSPQFPTAQDLKDLRGVHINNSRGVEELPDYVAGGRDLYLQDTNAKGATVNITFRSNILHSIEEREADLEDFYLMVSTFEYLD